MKWTVTRKQNGHYELNLVSKGEVGQDLFIFHTFPTYEAMNMWLADNGYTQNDLTRRIK